MVRSCQWQWFPSLLGVVALALFCLTAQAEEEKKADDTKHAAAKAESAPSEGKEGKTTEEKGHDAKAGEKAHEGSHHGDPTDNSHANASHNLSSPTAFQTDQAIFTFAIFLILMAILTKFAWKPIAHGLEAREKGIEEKIEQARIAAEKATEQLKEYEARLAAATQEAQQIVAEARKTADSAKESILSDAQALAQKEREKAVADISTAKNQALREIAEKSVDTAIGLARNIIRREVRAGDHEQLIQDALKQFPNN